MIGFSMASSSRHTHKAHCNLDTFALKWKDGFKNPVTDQLRK